jgi:hyperosmotically inducible periplasmic protein
MKNPKRRMMIAACALLACMGAHAQGPASTTKAAHAADRALQKNVRRALARTKGLDVLGITVRARDGDVVLEGSVPEQAEIEQATQVAKGVAGVRSVRNALTIHIPQ